MKSDSRDKHRFVFANQLSSAILPFVLIALILGLCGCEDDNCVCTPEIGPGSLFVRVQDSDSIEVPDAIVLTRPETERKVTDELGTVLIESIETGTYTVWATHGAVGSGNKPVDIAPNTLSEIVITMDSGICLQPSVEITSPECGDTCSYIDTVSITALVSDLNDLATDLDLTWSSSLDGILSTSPTDESGIAELNALDLSRGEHLIYLHAENSDSLVGVDSVLVVVTAMPPEIEMLLPEPGLGFTPGEMIIFRAVVSDYETPVTELYYEWSSDLSGVLGTGYPYSEGNAVLVTTELPAGVHNITLSVTDTDTLTSTASIEVNNQLPLPIDLLSATTLEGRVTLIWEESFDAEYDHNEIYRSLEPGTLGDSIGQVTTAATTTFIDINAPLVNTAYYQVRIYNTYGNYRETNQLEVVNPGGLVFASEPSAVLLHPTETWIYLDYGGTIFLVDFHTMEILKTCSVTAASGFKELGDCGQGLEIYSPSTDGLIRIIDPINLSVIASISTGDYTMSAVPGANGIIYASVAPDPWWDRTVPTYNRTTGVFIEGSEYPSPAVGRLRLLPSGNEALLITTAQLPRDMDYFLFNDSGNIVTRLDDSQHGETVLEASLFKLSPNGEFVITGMYSSMYSANSSMSYLGELQRTTRTFVDYTFSPDGNTIYAAVEEEQLILVFSYPAMDQIDEIVPRSMPLFIERQDDKLIIVGSINEESGSPEAAVGVITLTP